MRKWEHSIRVFVTKDESGWFAEGLDIDCFAHGNSREDVEQKFVRGLTQTFEFSIKKNNGVRWLFTSVKDTLQNLHDYIGSSFVYSPKEVELPLGNELKHMFNLDFIYLKSEVEEEK